MIQLECLVKENSVNMRSVTVRLCFLDQLVKYIIAQGDMVHEQGVLRSIPGMHKCLHYVAMDWLGKHIIGLFKMFSCWILHIFTAQIQSE